MFRCVKTSTIGTRQRLLYSPHLCRIHTSDMGMKRNHKAVNVCNFKASKLLITSMTVDCWYQFKPQLKRDCMWCISDHDNFKTIKSFKWLEIYHLIMFWKLYSTENRRSGIYAPFQVMWKQCKPMREDISYVTISFIGRVRFQVTCNKYRKYLTPSHLMEFFI